MNGEYTSAIVIIGDEILSGRTQDQNLAFLGKRLAELGIILKVATVIPDDAGVIVNTINDYRKKYSYVFTSGGIGPTHDDITSATVARAFNVELERNPEAVQLLEEYYPTGTVNAARLKMADIPVGAVLIKNPVSGAPGFQLENVFVLPGVPLILQAMFDGITDRLVGGPAVLSRSISTNISESALAVDLEKLQQQYHDVVIGSYPFFKRGVLGVSLVMRSTDTKRLDNVMNEAREMIVRLNGKILDTT